VTGSLCANFLSRNDSSEKPLTISVWDKGRGAGGRMSTSRCPGGALSCSADLGAQYFTPMHHVSGPGAINKHWTPEKTEFHKSIFEELLDAGVLRAMDGRIDGDDYDYAKQKTKSKETSISQADAKSAVNDELKHFVAVNGSSAVVKHFLKEALNTKVDFNETIESLTVTEDKKRWCVKTKEGKSEEFPCVILTMPVPQILQLQGDIRDLISSPGCEDVKAKLEKVVYSSRYALAAWFGPEVTLDMTWCAKYYNDDPCIRYVAIDAKKRGVQNEVTGSSIVIHTSVPFGLKHLEDDVNQVKELILAQMVKRIPELKDQTPVNVKCQRWRYSQVYKRYQDSPGCVMLSSSPLLLLAGDAFVEASRFDGCVDSALAVTNCIKHQTNHGINY